MTALVPAGPVDIDDVVIDYSAVLKHLKLEASDPKAQALLLVCKRYRLDPVLGHARIIDGNVYVTHKGLLHVAHRSGVLDCISPIEETETETHYVAKVSVWRTDKSRPFTYTGRFPKGVMIPVYEWSGPSGNRKKNKVGEEPHQYGPEMAVTRGECHGLRRAFDVALPVWEEQFSEDDQPIRAEVARTEGVEHRIDSGPEMSATVRDAAASTAGGRTADTAVFVGGADPRPVADSTPRGSGRPAAPSGAPSASGGTPTEPREAVRAEPVAMVAAAGDPAPPPASPTQPAGESSRPEGKPQAPEDRPVPAAATLADHLLGEIGLTKEQAAERLKVAVAEIEKLNATGLARIVSRLKLEAQAAP